MTPGLWPAIQLSMAVAISNGIARFAYGLVLPAMREDLQWTYATAGLLNTVNAVGYMLGALAGYAGLRAVSPARAFRIGTGIVVGSLLATPVLEDFWHLAVMRSLTGFGSAWMFSCGAALVSKIYANHARIRGMATGLYFAGAGIGMILSGAFVPRWLEQMGSTAWESTWYAIGVASALLAVLPLRVAAGLKHDASLSPAAGAKPIPIAPYLPCLSAYLLFGAGNNVYLTFLAAWINERGEGWQAVTLAWCVLGFGICLSPLIWARALNTWPATRTLATCLLTTAVGVSISFLGSGGLPTLTSALLYGLSLFIAPTSVTLLARSTRPASEWASYVALFTLMFSVGQSVGPWAAGVIADHINLTAGMAFSVAIILLGAALANAPSEAKTWAYRSGH